MIPRLRLRLISTRCLYLGNAMAADEVSALDRVLTRLVLTDDSHLEQASIWSLLTGRGAVDRVWANHPA